MEPFVQDLSSYSPWLASLLVASVWQGMLLIAGVALVLRALRGVSATARTTVWTVALFLSLLLPVLGSTQVHAGGGHGVTMHLPAAWSEGLIIVWLLASVFWAVRLLVHGARLAKVTRNAVPVQAMERIAALLEGPRRAVLCVSPEVDRPSVAGFFRPRVLLPEGLLETLSPAELEHVVLHEMEHLRRGDDWLNLLQQISLVLLPLHPALLWLDRRLCRERELACDDGVLRATGAPKAYAACLVKLAEDSMVRKGLAMALSALGTRAHESELVGRVRRILAAPRQASAQHARFAAGALSLSMLAGAAALAHSPTLVAFGPAPQLAAAQTAPAAWPKTGALTAQAVRAVPVSLPGEVKPVLARAVVQEGVHTHRLMPALAVVRKRIRPRALPARAVAAPAGTWQAREARAILADGAGQRDPAVTGAYRRVLTAAPQEGRVVVTEFVVPQPEISSGWAAVPVQGGWLLVQL